MTCQYKDCRLTDIECRLQHGLGLKRAEHKDEHVLARLCRSNVGGKFGKAATAERRIRAFGTLGEF